MGIMYVAEPVGSIVLVSDTHWRDVAAQVLALAPARRACYGTHVPYALMVLWRAGEETGGLSAAMRQRQPG